MRRLPASPNLYPDLPQIVPVMKSLAVAYRDIGRLPEAGQVRALLRQLYQMLADVLLRGTSHARLAGAAAGFPEMFPERGEGCVRAAGLLARCVPLALKDDRLPEEKRRQLAGEYEDDALRFLRRAIDEGFSNADELRTAPAFESLRSRDEFKKLLKGLESGSK